jgi:hypothetical protein
VSTTEQSEIAQALRDYGRTMKLRRRVGTTSSYIDVDVFATDRHYTAAEIQGLLQQGDRDVTIGTAEITAASWPAPPRKSDLLVIDGISTAIQTVEPRYFGTVLLAYKMTVRG